MDQISFTVIILAAGKGTRMRSPLPKVLHPVAGSPILYNTVKVVQEAGADEVRVVVGYGENLVRRVVEPLGAKCFKQEKTNGTAKAVWAAQPASIEGTVVILNGDHPLLRANDIVTLVKKHSQTGNDLSVVSCELESPGSFGRIVRSGGQLRAIVEAKDASSETLKIREVNTGVFITSGELLSEYLPLIECNNAQGEYYLTDIVALLQENRLKSDAILGSPKIAFGVNSQKELALATKTIFKEKAEELLDAGVTIVDPDATYIEQDVEVGEGTIIYPGVYLKEGAVIGRMCVIEPNAYIQKANIGDEVHIKAGSYLTGCTIGNKATIGPYAHIRPDSEIGSETKVGNFVEMKKVKFGNRSKAGHLTYLGDAIVGEDTNIGCGTITCNYAADRKKYVTKIGHGVFVGSDTQFVAPVEIGDNSIIGSGSTITKDVPEDALAVARGRQITKKDYNKKS